MVQLEEDVDADHFLFDLSQFGVLAQSCLVNQILCKPCEAENYAPAWRQLALLRRLPFEHLVSESKEVNEHLLNEFEVKVK